MLSSDEFDRRFDSWEEILYEWDEEKRKANIQKHGLDFREVESFATKKERSLYNGNS
ncbi:hypothetical protein R83H12_00235 [Fibrobacteria bacterium R8-3-H12]